MAYIGVSPSNGVRQKHTYTATANQTSFSGAGAEGISLSYLDSNYVDVYQNGVKLSEADYTSTTGTTVVLAQGASVSDMIEIIVYDVFSVADTVSKADGGTFDASVTFAGDIIKSTSGTSNFAAGVNAGNSIASGGNYNTVVGDEAGTALTTGDSNVAIGFEALATEDANGLNVAVGYRALKTLNASGAAYNTAVGYDAGTAITTSQYNTIVGGLAADALTTGNENTALGVGALGTETAGDRNVAVGNGALSTQNTTGGGDIYNVAVGYNTGTAVTTGVFNTLVGGLAGDALNTGGYNVAIGTSALSADTKGSKTVAIGLSTLANQNFTSATDSNNTAVGYSAGNAVTTGTSNTLLGSIAGDAITDSDGNTALGYGALSAEQQGNKSTAVGWQALLQANRGSSGDSFNTAVGYNAASGINTGVKNTFIGGGSGSAVTSGDANTILGAYNGNNGGLDIRTADNYIVLSDGDGNPRAIINNNGSMVVGSVDHSPFQSTEGHFVALNDATRYGAIFGCDNVANREAVIFVNPNGLVGSIRTNGSSTSYNTSSDHRLKENVADMTGAIDRVKQLSPKRFNFISDADTTVDGFLAHEAQAIVAEAVTGTHNEVDDNGDAVMQGIDQSKLVPLLTSALKEAIAKIEDLEAKVTALEGA